MFRNSRRGENSSSGKSRLATSKVVISVGVGTGVEIAVGAGLGSGVESGVSAAVSVGSGDGKGAEIGVEAAVGSGTGLVPGESEELQAAAKQQRSASNPISLVMLFRRRTDTSSSRGHRRSPTTESRPLCRAFRERCGGLHALGFGHGHPRGEPLRIGRGRLQVSGPRGPHPLALLEKLVARINRTSDPVPGTPLSTSLTPSSRPGLLAELEGKRFDLLVIGGGITGAGVARDAARRGLRVALVEKNDYAAGTSSRSSKLIHGGLRYLAMGEVGLVRETARARQAVHQMAPHLAEPCWMVVPAHNRASLMKFRAGIATYEKLGAVDDADRHLSWDRDSLAQQEACIRRDEYPWACAYREYMTDDARLVLAVLRDAAGSGACVANRLPVVDVIWEGNHIGGVVAACELSGDRVEIRADAVVNATGPWVERLARFEEEAATDRLHPSKGIHIVVDAARLPVRNLVIMATADKRSVFVLPRGDTVAIGTTDTSYQGKQLLWPEIERADVAYLLHPLKSYFDVDPLGFDDVVAAWSGVRPLVAQKGKEATEISRKEEVWVGTGGMITIAGGKLTGFRAMAMRVLDHVAERLGRSLGPRPGPDPIPGGSLSSDLDAYATSLAAATGVGRPLADRLVRLYGDETNQVLALGHLPIVPDGRVVAGEVVWAVKVDGALTLEDLIYRRTRAAWYTPAERDDLVAPAASLMGDLLEWDKTRTAAEIDAVRARYASELQFKADA